MCLHRSSLTFLILATLAMQVAPNAKADIFSDDFTGASLNPAWQVLPGNGSYSLTGNTLRYYNEGYMTAPFGWWGTSLGLALTFSSTHYEADVKATYHLTWLSAGTYTGPAVQTFVNSAGGQIQQVLMGFDSSSLANEYAQFYRGVDAWYGSDNLLTQYCKGATCDTSDNLIPLGDQMIVDNVADGTWWYRFVRNGGALAMSYSTDGVNYSTPLDVLLANPASDYNRLVLSGTTYMPEGSYADYDFVHIRDLSAVPEPGTWVLLATVTSLIWIRERRRRRP